MTADSAQREPTMEEILASIRRIISEEDEPESGNAGVLELEQPFDESEAEAEFDAEPAVEEDEFDMEAAMRETAPPKAPSAEPTAPEDLMILEKEEETAPPPPAPEPKAAPRPAFSAVEDGIVEDSTAQLAAGSLHRLLGTMTVSSDNTLDDIVRSLLKPMLKDWLDANLPQIVETVVQKEVDRIRRMAR